MHASVNLTQELHNLQEKKSTLEQAVKIAASLEKLNHSLNAVILLGEPTSSISKKSLANIEELNEKTRILSSQKLKEILDQLEKTVHEKLALILKITRKEEGSDTELPEDDIGNLHQDEIDVILKDYLKKAQTAVALKVLLRARGEITKPTKFSRPVKDIKKKLSVVKKREKLCRNRVKNEMLALINDTRNMLTRDDLSDNIREMIKYTHESLRLNLLHMEAGKSIDTMPVAIESIEMASDEMEPILSNTKLSGNKPGSVHTPDLRTVKKYDRPGILHKIWVWITTPASVGWNDIDKVIQRKKERNR